MPTALPPFLSQILSFAGVYRYPLLLVGTIIEGPVLMIACGLLLRQGVFELVPLFLVLVLGDLIADIGWYYIGYWFAGPLIKRYGHIIGVSQELFTRAQGLFHRYHVKILLISKVTIGFGMALATLLAAGASRVPFRMYFLLNLIGEIILVAALLGVGYFFGQVSEYFGTGFKIVFIVVALLAAAVAMRQFSRYIKQTLIKES